MIAGRMHFAFYLSYLQVFLSKIAWWLGGRFLEKVSPLPCRLSQYLWNNLIAFRFIFSPIIWISCIIEFEEFSRCVGWEMKDIIIRIWRSRRQFLILFIFTSFASFLLTLWCIFSASVSFSLIASFKIFLLQAIICFSWFISKYPSNLIKSESLIAWSSTMWWAQRRLLLLISDVISSVRFGRASLLQMRDLQNLIWALSSSLARFILVIDVSKSATLTMKLFKNWVNCSLSLLHRLQRSLNSWSTTSCRCSVALSLNLISADFGGFLD